MKRMRKIALPLAILFIGAGSAYATSLASETKKAEIPGWKIDLANPENPCVMTDVQCSTENTGNPCEITDGSGVHQLYESSCETELFRVIP